MLTWDEEIKPTSPALNSGLFANREVTLSLREAAPSPLSQQTSCSNSSSAARMLDDGIAQRVAQRRVSAADNRIEYCDAEDTMPCSVLGLNASIFKGSLRDMANRRAAQIGLETLYLNEEDPFPWMIETIDLKKERHFFETRVIECQTGGALSWIESSNS